MPKSEIRFQTLITLPGSPPKDEQQGSISYTAMMNTIDRAFDRGKWHGWQEAMAAVRKAAEGEAGDERRSVEDAIRAAADTCRLRTDA